MADRSKTVIDSPTKSLRPLRKVVPRERLLIFRISNWGVADMEVSLFENKAEWQQMIKLLSAEPIDAISVSTYGYSDKGFRNRSEYGPADARGNRPSDHDLRQNL